MAPPNYIPLPPPPTWSSSSVPSDLSADSAASPAALFYTPPTSPPSPSVYYTPPTSPFHDPLPFAHPQIQSLAAVVAEIGTPAVPEDAFPLPTDVAIDLALDEEGLSTLEKIYLYSRSKAYHHRIFIAHQLPEYLDQVSPQEAVEYVLPLLSGLAMDEDEAVKEALTAELVPIIWWFFSHCHVIPDDLSNEEKYASSSTTVTISVQAFTPILGTLLLNENKRVGVLARESIVGFLARMNKVDDRERVSPHLRRRRRSLPHLPEVPDDDDDTPFSPGSFSPHERSLFRQEILQQIVVGLGRLDNEASQEDERLLDQMSTGTPQSQPQSQSSSPAPTSPSAHGDWSNPYFPPVYENSSARSSPSPGSDGSPQRNSPSPSLPAVHSPNGIQRTLSSSSASAAQARLNFSPGTEFPPAQDHAPTAQLLPPIRDPIAPLSPQREVVSTPNPDLLMNVDSESEMTEDQCTLGRIVCMSLIAAVVAGTPLEDDILLSFLDEVEGVVRDPYYKVRQAASFALGALAKEIPDSLVPRLLPLFDDLRWDTVWVVRHSALFALPAILDRLTAPQRRTVALETVVALSTDSNPTVRSGVLECLGEVIYTFVNTPAGPPEELLKLFLGRPEDKKVRTGSTDPSVDLETAIQNMQDRARTQLELTPIESFYTQDKRPLICAFNFPAVVLTLGNNRWIKVRDFYLDLTLHPNPSVQRSLAASVGEIAKIIGASQARIDLVDVWWRFVKAAESEVRAKALEYLTDFMAVVGAETGLELLKGLLEIWNKDQFRGWREREVLVNKLPVWLEFVGDECAMVIRDLVVKGLEDGAATVREAAIAIIPRIWASFSTKPEVLGAFQNGIRQLATSGTSRRRMTFIACQQRLVLSLDRDGQTLIPLDEASLRAVSDLASDGIEGVRIGVARFAALIYRNLLRRSSPVPPILFDLVRRLKQDGSREVRSYVEEVSIVESSRRVDTPQPESSKDKERKAQVALFSRPPISGSLTLSESSSLPSRSDSGIRNQYQLKDELSRGVSIPREDDASNFGLGTEIICASPSALPSHRTTLSPSSQIENGRDIAASPSSSADSGYSSGGLSEPAIDSSSLSLLSVASLTTSIEPSLYGNRSGLTTSPRASIVERPPRTGTLEVYQAAPPDVAVPFAIAYDYSSTASERSRVPA